MRMHWFVVAALLGSFAIPRVAEACSCCGSVTMSRPVGWSQAGGALLIETTSNAGCSNHHVLEVWVVGTSEAAGCYDLLDDPERRIACGLTDHPRDAQLRTSSQTARFPRAATALPDSDVRVRNTVARAGGTGEATVDVMTAHGWARVWSTAHEQLDENRQVNRDFALPVDVSVWPNPRGDRALLLITSIVGSGHHVVAMRWVEMPH